VTDRPNQRRSRRPAARPPTKQPGLWDAVAPLGPPEQIQPALDPTAVIASLGPPPLRGTSSAAEHYLAAVVERAAALATALAASAQLLADPDNDE
jgi:hypothetical protein